MEPPDDATLPGIVQEALSRIGVLLDTLFETAEDAIFLMDGIRFLDCNPATLRMFGCRSKDEIVGRNPAQFSPDRQADGAESTEKAGRLVEAAMEGVPQRFEWRHCRLDRTEFEVEVRLNRCIVGHAYFLVAVVRDVTARKRAEASLRRQLQARELINGILGRAALCAPSQFDAHMVESLRELADFIGVDHACFFMTSADRSTYSCTHESCGPNVTPLRMHYQNVPKGTNAWTERTLLEHQMTRIDDLDPSDSTTHVGCRSLLLIPTSGTSEEFTGTIGLGSHARPIRWSDGDVMLCNIIGNVLTGTTERTRAELRLREQKQFSDRLIDSLPGIFYLYDSSLTLRRWNKNHERLLDYSAKELRGTRMEDLLPSEEVRDRTIATARAILQHDGAMNVLETQVCRKNGSVVPLLCSGTCIDSPDGPVLLGVGIDLTARVQAEKALATSERNYRALFDAMNDALFILDTDGNVLDVNERACALFGIDADQARRLSIEDLSIGDPPPSRRDALDELHRAVREGPRIFDWQSRRRDGTSFWSEVALRAFQTEDEVRITASVRDITERKLAGLERERLMKELQAASHAKDQFLAVLSHELRNPLAAIMAGVGVLRGSSAIDEPNMAHAIDVIERNVKLQARLVGDLLDLSRIVRGKLTIERAPVLLYDVARSAVQTCRSDAARADVSLETRAESNPWVYADADRIQQIIINLVDNGIKYTPRGGRVEVSVTATEHYGHIIVEDTGVGLQTDRLQNMFEMFQQGQVGEARAPGLGIGLALVRSLAEHHEGRVSVESGGHGRGSRFTVAIPRCEAPSIHEAPLAASPSPSRVRLLLVEDNDDIRTMLAEMLTRRGYDVIPAPSAEVALDILTRETVQVILADIGLPGVDGYELLRQARRLPTAARALAFALTGHGQESDTRRAQEVGYTDHFVKPMHIEELDRRIRSHLESSSG